MPRRGCIVALAAVLLALPAAAHGAGERTSCQKLTGKEDLAPAKRVKLFERKSAHATTLTGCVLPAGHIVLLASRYHEDGGQSGDYALRLVKGHQVVFTFVYDTPTSHLHSTEVVDLKKPRRYTIASRCHETESGNCSDRPDETALRVRINTSGQAAAIVASETSDLVRVIGYSPRGTRRVLDTGTRKQIPPESLKVEGHTASWTNNGAHKSARLPKTTECERLGTRNDMAGANKVKLVERRNEDGGTDLVGCVLPSGKVSTVASSSKMGGQERTYDVLQVTGHVVLVRGDVVNPYGHAVSTYVFDLKRASSYTLAESCFNEHGAACDQTYARRAFVNFSAQAAALIRTDGSKEREVVGFSSTGAREVLDTGTAAQIPASSLSLDGHVVRWTHSGTPRSATLSG